MITQQILEEAKIRFPPGTIAKNTNIKPLSKSTFIVKDCIIDDDRILAEVNPISTYTIYEKGKWAKVISLPEYVPIIFN